VIACSDMKNVYNHASGAIKGIDCALHQCVRVISVPAWMLKLGIEPSALFNSFKLIRSNFQEATILV